MFIGPRFLPHDELLTSLGCQVDDNGWVATDATGRTGAAGVWAAGNVVDEPQDIEQAVARASQRVTW